jgi:hypothetical protein
LKHAESYTALSAVELEGRPSDQRCKPRQRAALSVSVDKIYTDFFVCCCGVSKLLVINNMFFVARFLLRHGSCEGKVSTNVIKDETIV